MHTIESKLPNVGTTIFTQMSQLANEVNAINLSQGFPNFKIDTKLEDIMANLVRTNAHQYLPMMGYNPLRSAVADKIQLHYGRKVDFEKEILITAGATQGIFTAIQALVHRGDEVVVIDPSYDCYAPAVELVGAKPVHINMEKGFRIDWNKIEAAMNEKTRMLIINNPHNPTGMMFDLSDIEALEAILEKYPEVLLLSDEVYEFIHFEKEFISINSREKIRERAIIISSFGKTFHITGWKLGYLVAPDYLLQEIKKVHQYLVFCVNSFGQLALAEYLPQTDLNELSAFYQQKKDFFTAAMKNSKFELLPSYGSYFVTANYSAISDLDDVSFSKWLTTEKGVAVIPTSVFNANKRDDKVVRFCFAKTEETLQQATDLLCKI
ncbi:2-keto-4-methylthiobutyrate aminotransferase apoenzyme [Lishizhenia tianjinensis]|uniref:2-keto-4-methylthiobutyrate aminotransferase apoenzyme n=1 Tax=Lishizhenia tianjinensis TaxID=477690 RepID=A0A1I6ZPY9_9FLAO|nr:methionine aminotransferase [Lishizhenia tianjinensis]SFT64768.1 2-keto-4-methylthiobutyrate aminotransferase apoenzyme [Lishizhenia tianjinensis]